MLLPLLPPQHGVGVCSGCLADLFEAASRIKIAPAAFNSHRSNLARALCSAPLRL